MNIPELVKYFCTMGTETEWVEFKENNYEPHLIGEYLSALSNSACIMDQQFGYLIFGVDNATYEVVGTKYNYRKEKVGDQEVENWLATQLKPSTNFRIYNDVINEKNVVVFVVDAAKNIPVCFRGDAYVRVGSYKHKLKKFPEKERLIWNRDLTYVFEKELCKLDISEKEILELLDFTTFLTQINLSPSTSQPLVIEKLLEYSLIRKTNGKFAITNMGAILYARDLKHFDRLNRKTFRIIHYAGNNRIRTIVEHTGTKGYAIGFEGMIDYINNRIPSNEIINKAFREQVRVYPEIAIRELLANAIIHQDFTATGTSPMFEIFDDRVEITNPGQSLIETLRFIDHAPKSRNENIASFMRLINLCEERGSGIDKVVSSVEQYGLPAPKFISEQAYTKVVLYSYSDINKMSKEDKVRACYQHCVLRYVSNEQMTNETLRRRFNIDSKNAALASRIIIDTLEEKLIKDFDPTSKSRKYAKYIPIWA